MVEIMKLDIDISDYIIDYPDDEPEKKVFKKREKGQSLVEFADDYVVIDIETTGLDAVYDDIIELSAVRFINNIETDRFSSLVNLDWEIPSYITEITGITNEMLETAPNLKDVLPKYLDFLGDSILVGHNVNFDINFIYDKAEELGIKFKNDYIDTLRFARKLLKELKNHRLATVKEYFGITSESAHRALPDCIATHECYLKLKNRALSDYENLEAFSASFKKKNANHSYSIKNIAPNADAVDEDHIFYQKYCVFTGALEKMVRKDAAQLVVNIGGFCEDSVTKKTNFLILGNNDYCKSIKDGKSKKQKKAEELKLKGQDIEIISENTFYDLLEI